MFSFYTCTLTAVVRNTSLGFAVSANSLTAFCNFDSLLGSVQDTVIGKVHLEKWGMSSDACISSIRLLGALKKKKREDCDLHYFGLYLLRINLLTCSREDWNIWIASQYFSVIFFSFKGLCSIWKNSHYISCNPKTMRSPEDSFAML